MATKRYVALDTRIRGKKALVRLAKTLSDKGITPTVVPELAKDLGKATCTKHAIEARKPSARPKPELAVALGGDGSFLQLAARYATYSIPLIGVNLGKVGFLADIKSDSMALDIIKVLKGKYRDEKRIILQVNHVRAKKVIDKQTAINDFVIDRGGFGSLITIGISIDDKHSFDLRSDGLVIGTPGGSTAYNMSAGGPIITPDCECFTLTPLNPYSLTQRPLVFSNNRKVSIKVDRPASVKLDGRTSQIIDPTDTLEITAYKNQMIVRHPLNYDYFKTLSNKLYWSHDG